MSMIRFTEKRRSNLVRGVALSLLCTMALTSCYQYVPVAQDQPLPERGSEVRARLSPARELDLGAMRVIEINRVDGSIYSGENDSLALWTQWVHSAYGQRFYANGSVFYFPRQDITRLEERRLVPARTALAVGASVATLALIFGLAIQLGGGEAGGEPPGPNFTFGVPIP